MTNEGLVTAIIPAFNAERYVGDAIESVLNQSYRHVECVVVDDGSTDSSRTVASSFGDRVRMIAQPNRGVSNARNTGIAAARGTYVAFLDADDVWLRDKLERQLELMLADPELGLIYTGLRLVDAQLRPLAEVPPAAADVALRNTLLLEQPYMSIPSTGLVPRLLLEQIGGFDEQLSTSADTDLACRIAIRHPVACVPAPLVLYRIHDRQMHNDLTAMENDMLLIFEKLFNDPALPPELRTLRRRAEANLYATFAGHHLKQRAAKAFVRSLVLALRAHPLRTSQLALRKLANTLHG